MRRPFVLIATLLLLGAGCAGPVVSPTDQVLLRDTDRLHLRLSGACIEGRSPRIQRYLGELAGRVTAAARDLDQQGGIKSVNAGGSSNAWMFSGIEAHLVDAPIPSSFSPGGKHIYLYQGLVQQCKNEDELASLLCREFAHVYARHSLETVKRPPGMPVEDAQLLAPFATMRWTAAQMKEADTIGFAIFTRSGWDPLRFAALYDRLAEHAPAPTVPIDPAWLRKRAEDVRRQLDSLPDAAREWAKPPIADDARFAQLQAEVGTIASTQAAPREAVLLLAAFPRSLTLADTPAQVQARAALFPPPAAGTENKWGKGLPGR